jgi:hypothetical protein
VRYGNCVLIDVALLIALVGTGVSAARRSDFTGAEKIETPRKNPRPYGTGLSRPDIRNTRNDRPTEKWRRLDYGALGSTIICDAGEPAWIVPTSLFVAVSTVLRVPFAS